MLTSSRCFRFSWLLLVIAGVTRPGMVHSATATVTVKDPDGNNAANAVVCLGTYAKQRTNSSGQAIFQNVSTGTFLLRANRNDYRENSKHVSVPGGSGTALFSIGLKKKIRGNSRNQTPAQCIDEVPAITQYRVRVTSDAPTTANVRWRSSGPATQYQLATNKQFAGAVWQPIPATAWSTGVNIDIGGLGARDICLRLRNGSQYVSRPSCETRFMKGVLLPTPPFTTTPAQETDQPSPQQATRTFRVTGRTNVGRFLGEATTKGFTLRTSGYQVVQGNEVPVNNAICKLSGNQFQAISPQSAIPIGPVPLVSNCNCRYEILGGRNLASGWVLNRYTFTANSWNYSEEAFSPSNTPAHTFSILCDKSATLFEIELTGPASASGWRDALD